MTHQFITQRWAGKLREDSEQDGKRRVRTCEQHLTRVKQDERDCSRVRLSVSTWMGTGGRDVRETKTMARSVDGAGPRHKHGRPCEGQLPHGDHPRRLAQDRHAVRLSSASTC